MSTFQDIMETLGSLLKSPRINEIDIVEIIIIAFFIYEIMLWIKNTQAWMLFKGLVMILAFAFIAAVFNMSTILWLAEKAINVGIIAVIIVFQPELRKALEQLGRKNLFTSIFNFESSKNAEGRFSDKTITEITKAVFEMAKVKTGALIVVEQEILLKDYERTGIPLDSIVSSQLLINIFEHNTPLHDGAVIIRGDRIIAATCYLPLSDNMFLSKDLGTRHRAAVGISEATDSLTVVVSEETGSVSIAIGGELFRNIDAEYLKGKLTFIQNRSFDVKRFKLWKGRMRHVKKDNK
ncbi:TIGR00159 family protein [Anaerosacchariphilus polymeriproducens]|uniref:Diadenylate cyclase n=1 Tax=Anaerosacchariphilus polymeriproducens TaxID=1812858 RepID=A0A371AR78_9FIRM|nr:diadenylate cyclase CdaA [Anaerosacchariphilus polymeriproducens]RDU22079.1 TIGR00159 family protein [Anaerosacchariphilus polymeriproducens]